MSNQIEYFQHLVDTAEDPTMKWVLEEQLQKERRRIAKKKLADRAARAKAETETQHTEESVSVEEPKRRGRKPKEE